MIDRPPGVTMPLEVVMASVTVVEAELTTAEEEVKGSLDEASVVEPRDAVSESDCTLVASVSRLEDSESMEVKIEVSSCCEAIDVNESGTSITARALAEPNIRPSSRLSQTQSRFGGSISCKCRPFRLSLGRWKSATLRNGY